ncbi:acyl-CoA dehydrogenase family protein [Frankia sp. CNm7]|uniref:Acyl-CoA dehydrogenase family protein n=1 Tax=Frankia nepalensis TaxID=1836974 RepID=A0A937RWQ0_9ACTN|nr:acyl-CoA dehydrogenase family protein [Frankia nepalensis]MBL7498694.1 acyl-CoA dehydrogenase family protein [Frankia nepalensis]MBL7512916.1 acyl-CoA dehydrogenase family protein [Frankia nepalensis]MBL7521650.1 acyl-CoA dehydrogenase family protein [Frankia nepalensis]MBL7633221.1 acyl-CoA dehydrogenase family protein [Frankia nepalensis]
MTDPSTDPSPAGHVDAPPLDDYRARARAWVEANLERAPQTRPARGGDMTPQAVTEARALQRRLYDAGYVGITVARAYGGQGLGPEYERAFHEEARGYRLPDFGIAGGTTFGVVVPTMLAHAAPAFLRRHIPKILAGEELFVEFFSEPDAGSDLAGVRSQAVRDGERWVLSGSKIWSSGAYYADWGMCLARTNWDVPKHRGLTWFAVPIAAKGVTVQRIRQITGDAEFCQEFFDDVELTDDDIIGGVGDGWTVTQTMLIYERGGGFGHGGPARQAPKGIAPDLVELARSVGRLDDPTARDLIARAHVDDVARRALLARLGGRMRAEPGQAMHLASYAKLASGVFDPPRANLAMRIGGSDAVAWDDGDEAGARTANGFLNSRFMSIAGGTNEVQRNGIGERVLGLPREPSFDSGKPFREVLRDARSWTGRPAGG